MRAIIDTDPGVDDAQAIAFAVLCGGFEIEALTTTYGNCSVLDATINAMHVLALTGRSDIPVFRGAAGPLLRRRVPHDAGALIHGPSGTGGVTIARNSEAVQPSTPHAAYELARRVMNSPGEVTVLALGPLTNVALAMRLEPRFIESVHRIVFMGGIVQGPGNVSPVATANVLNDAEAASIVFSESQGKLTMVGQDVTRHVRILDEQYERIGACGEVGKYLHDIAAFYRQAYRRIEPHIDGFPVHDLLVMAYALRPELFGTELLPVRIEVAGELTTGMTVADFRANTTWTRDVTVCLRADGEAILNWYEDVLRGSEPGVST